MHTILSFFVGLTVVFVFAPAAFSQSLNPKCRTRNEALKIDTNDVVGECLIQIQTASTACAKDPSVTDEDKRAALAAGANGGARGIWDFNAQIHLMKKKKYVARASLCLKSVEPVKAACDKLVDDMTASVKSSNGQDPQKSVATMHSVNSMAKAEKAAMDALTVASGCDTAQAQIEASEADQAKLIADGIGAGQMPPSGPGSASPDPTKFADGSGYGVTGTLNAEGNSANTPSLLTSLTGQDKSLYHGVAVTLGVKTAFGSGAMSAANGDYKSSIQTLAPEAAAGLGMTTLSTNLSVFGAVYTGFTVGAAPSGNDDAPLARAAIDRINPNPGH
jgi:hypothetical protein